MDDHLLEANGKDPMGIYLKTDFFLWDGAPGDYPEKSDWLDNKGMYVYICM